MADPTPAEVHAALAILAAAETAREVAAAHVTPPVQAEDPAAADASQTASVLAAVTVAPVVVDPYVARSLKDSPNGF